MGTPSQVRDGHVALDARSGPMMNVLVWAIATQISREFCCSYTTVTATIWDSVCGLIRGGVHRTQNACSQEFDIVFGHATLFSVCCPSFKDTPAFAVVRQLEPCSFI